MPDGKGPGGPEQQPKPEQTKKPWFSGFASFFGKREPESTEEIVNQALGGAPAPLAPKPQREPASSSLIDEILNPKPSVVAPPALSPEVARQRAAVLEEVQDTTGVDSETIADLTSTENGGETLSQADDAKFQRWLDLMGIGIGHEDQILGMDQGTIEDPRVAEIAADPLLKVKEGATEAFDKFRSACRNNVRNIIITVLVGIAFASVNQIYKHSGVDMPVQSGTSTQTIAQPNEDGPGFVPIPDNELPKFGPVDQPQPEVGSGDGPDPEDDGLKPDAAAPDGNGDSDADGGGKAAGDDTGEKPAPDVVPDSGQADSGDGMGPIDPTVGPLTVDPHNTNFAFGQLQGDHQDPTVPMTDAERAAASGPGTADRVADQIMPGFLNDPAKNTAGITLSQAQIDQASEQVAQAMIDQGYASADGSVTDQSNLRMFHGPEEALKAAQAVQAATPEVAPGGPTVQQPESTGDNPLPALEPGAVLGPSAVDSIRDQLLAPSTSANPLDSAPAGANELPTTQNPVDSAPAEGYIIPDAPIVQPDPMAAINNISAQPDPILTSDLSSLRPGITGQQTPELSATTPLPQPEAIPAAGVRVGAFAPRVIKAADLAKMGGVRKWVPGQSIIGKAPDNRTTPVPPKRDDNIPVDPRDISDPLMPPKVPNGIDNDDTLPLPPVKPKPESPKDEKPQSPAERERAARTHLRSSEKLIAKNPDAKPTDAMIAGARTDFEATASSVGVDSQRANAFWNAMVRVWQERGVGAVAGMAEDIKKNPDRLVRNYPEFLPDPATKPIVMPTTIGTISPDGQWEVVALTRKLAAWVPSVRSALKRWADRDLMYSGAKSMVEISNRPEAEVAK